MPWRAVYTGLDLSPAVDDPDPEVVTAARATRVALANAEIQAHARLARQHLQLERRADRSWRACWSSPRSTWPSGTARC